MAFVKKLIDHGFAYELDGSVYFDTRAYDNAPGHAKTGEVADWYHSYLKLEPWNKGNRALIQEGEGISSTQLFANLYQPYPRCTCTVVFTL